MPQPHTAVNERRGLLDNLRDRDNLSTADNIAETKVSAIRRFDCSHKNNLSQDWHELMTLPWQTLTSTGFENPRQYHCKDERLCFIVDIYLVSIVYWHKIILHSVSVLISLVRPSFSAALGAGDEIHPALQKRRVWPARLVCVYLQSRMNQAIV